MSDDQVAGASARPSTGNVTQNDDVVITTAPTMAEAVAEVLRAFPGSIITGSRLKDPAECHDAE